jgi:DNA-binding transcriptional MocR family regulator
MSAALPTLQVVPRPGIVELGPGHPDPGLLPEGLVGEAAAAVLADDGPAALGYGAAAGPGPLRAWIAAWAGAREGRAIAPEEVLITGGASGALAHVCTALTSPGAVALCASPAYHLAARTLRDHALRVQGVPSDEDGVLPGALREALDDLRRRAERAAFLYCVPSFSNPTGRTTSAARRAELLAEAERHELLVVEDDVYRELAYDGARPPALPRPPGEEPGVLRLGSFAKLLAPGLRVGWLVGPRPQVERLAAAGWLDSGGGTSHFAATVVLRLATGGAVDAHLATLQDAYAARRDALAAALREALPPGSQVPVPAGGFFLWATLPRGADAERLLPRAERGGVGYLPGRRFALPGAPVDEGALRLAFSWHSADVLREGARRLGRALAEHLDEEG